MEQEPAPSEVDEVRDLVSQTLESKGVLAKIRAELRAAVFSAIEEEERDTGAREEHPGLGRLRESEDGRATLALVAEFLDYYGLSSTKSVFVQEAGMGDSFDLPSIPALAQRLGVPSAGDDASMLGHLLQRQSKGPGAAGAYSPPLSPRDDRPGTRGTIATARPDTQRTIASAPGRDDWQPSSAMQQRAGESAGPARGALASTSSPGGRGSRSSPSPPRGRAAGSPPGEATSPPSHRRPGAPVSRGDRVSQLGAEEPDELSSSFNASASFDEDSSAGMGRGIAVGGGHSPARASAPVGEGADAAGGGARALPPLSGSLPPLRQRPGPEAQEGNMGGTEALDQTGESAPGTSQALSASVRSGASLLGSTRDSLDSSGETARLEQMNAKLDTMEKQNPTLRELRGQVEGGVAADVTGAAAPEEEEERPETASPPAEQREACPVRSSPSGARGREAAAGGAREEEEEEEQVEEEQDEDFDDYDDDFEDEDEESRQAMGTGSPAGQARQRRQSPSPAKNNGPAALEASVESDSSASNGLEEVSDDMSAGGASGDSDFFDGAAAAKADASDSGFGHSFEDQGSGGGLEKQYPFVDNL